MQTLQDTKLSRAESCGTGDRAFHKRRKVFQKSKEVQQQNLIIDMKNANRVKRTHSGESTD
jgi:hypothetical protein